MPRAITLPLLTPTPIRKKIYSPKERDSAVDKYLHGFNMRTVRELFPTVTERNFFEWAKKNAMVWRSRSQVLHPF